MKKFLLSLCLFALAQMILAQKLIVDDSVTLNRGIYKTFDEFRRNAPSLPLDYEILWGKILYGGLAVYNDTLYNLKVDKATAEAIGLIWGFCDGKDVYINMQCSMKKDKATGNNVKVFKPVSQFDKIKYLGRYCFFVTGQFSGGSVYPTHWAVALDFNTAREIYLDNSTLKDLIEKDEQLLSQFKDEKVFADKDAIYLKYLKLYSVKYRDEIKR